MFDTRETNKIIFSRCRRPLCRSQFPNRIDFYSDGDRFLDLIGLFRAILFSILLSERRNRRRRRWRRHHRIFVVSIFTKFLFRYIYLPFGLPQSMGLHCGVSEPEIFADKLLFFALPNKSGKHFGRRCRHPTQTMCVRRLHWKREREKRRHRRRHDVC